MDELVLVVDDEEQVARSIARFLERRGYRTDLAENGAEALRKLEHEEFAVMFADLLMPVMDGAELVRRASRLYPDLAIIVVTAMHDLQTAVRMLREGAYDYMTKPFEFEELTAAIQRALERRRLIQENRNYQRMLESKVNALAEELMTTYHQTIDALGAALDTRDPETQAHGVRVTQWAHVIAEKMGIDGDRLRDIILGATLHDVGKIGVSDLILFKKGPLTAEEMEQVKRHVDLGYHMLKGIPFLRGATPIVKFHHERFDGNGYLDGLAGKAIPLGARIFGIADTVDAITSDRPYRKAAPLAKAREEVINQSGKQFDPEVVGFFIRATESPNGWHKRPEFEAIAPVIYN